MIFINFRFECANKLIHFHPASVLKIGRQRSIQLRTCISVHIGHNSMDIPDVLFLFLGVHHFISRGHGRFEEQSFAHLTSTTDG